MPMFRQTVVLTLLGHLPAAFSSLLLLKVPGGPVLPQDASHYLHPSLASFSIETAFFEEFLGTASAPSDLSWWLFNNLHTRTLVPPEIRIGGITADSTYYNPNASTSLSNFIDQAGVLHNTTIGPGFWDSVNLLPEGSKITMNLNLRDLSYHGALSFAAGLLGGLPEHLDLFEIGNEPDHYLNFNPNNYSTIWSTWAKNITSALQLGGPRFQLAATVEDPLWPYNTTQANQQLNCVNALQSGVDFGNTVKSCSEHTYQYSVCDPQRAAVATLSNLVNHTRVTQYLDLWQPRIKTVRNSLGPHSFVIGEYNSVSCSGKDGVSNTFGQALWLLDTTLYAASLNISRLYIHQGGPLALQSSTQLNHGGLSFYNLWWPVDNLNGPSQVFPSYLAYLFVAETIGFSRTLKISNLYPGRQANGSSITTARGDKSAGEIAVYGFWDESTQAPFGQKYPKKLAILNLQIYNSTSTIPRPVTVFDISAYVPNPNSAIRVRRLTAPGADWTDTFRATWAGQTFATGDPRERQIEERLFGTHVVVAASEAVLVIF